MGIGPVKSCFTNKMKNKSKKTLRTKISILRYHNNVLNGKIPAAEYSPPTNTWNRVGKQLNRKRIEEKNCGN